MKWIINHVLLRLMHHVNHVKIKLMNLLVSFYQMEYVNILITHVLLYFVNHLMINLNVKKLKDVIGVLQIKFVENYVLKLLKKRFVMHYHMNVIGIVLCINANRV